ncbi:phosphoglycerate kinase [Mycoplasmoides genitalium]
MLNFKTLQAIDFQNKTVVLRSDFNVPIINGVISDSERILAGLDTIKFLVKKNCKIVLLSHLSRIKSLEDKLNNKKSLKPVAELLQQLLPTVKVQFSCKNTGAEVKQKVQALAFGEILLLENTRYCDVNDKGEIVKLESKNDPELAKFWASLGEIFVNDAFGTAHRKHASNAGIAKYVAKSCIGFLMEKELKNLSYLIQSPQKPFVVVLGGAKVSDKLKVVENLLKLADNILIGGGMVNTFLKAKGKATANSLVEKELIDVAKQILDKDTHNKIVLAIDQVMGSEFKDQAGITLDVSDKIQEQYQSYMSLDVGSKTIALFESYLKTAKTIFWNGPLGVFEFTNFAKGTSKIGEIIAKNKTAFSVIGGGDSAAAVKQMQLSDQFSFISTGGGASLALIGGEELVGISDIQKNS